MLTFLQGVGGDTRPRRLKAPFGNPSSSHPDAELHSMDEGSDVTRKRNPLSKDSP